MEQSAALAESGIGFAIAAMCNDGRSTLILFECTPSAAAAAAAAAAGVAMGTHRAVRNKPQPAP